VRQILHLFPHIAVFAEAIRWDHVAEALGCQCASQELFFARRSEATAQRLQGARRKCASDANVTVDQKFAVAGFYGRVSPRWKKRQMMLYSVGYGQSFTATTDHLPPSKGYASQGLPIAFRGTSKRLYRGCCHQRVACRHWINGFGCGQWNLRSGNGFSPDAIRIPMLILGALGAVIN